MPTLLLPYEPPLAWDALLAFLAARAVVGVEAVVEGAYLRTVECGGHRGWLSARADLDAAGITVELAPTLAPVQEAVAQRLRSLFDLDCRPAVIEAALPDLPPGPAGLRVPGAFDGFEIAVRAILGQQVTVAAATTLARRFGHRFGEPIAGAPAPLDRLTPRAEVVVAASQDELGQMGIIRTRGAAIRALAAAVADGTLTLGPGQPPAETMARLRTLPGVGDWTAQYIALRALAWRDAFPSGDIALQKAAGLPAKALLARAEAWRPWRAYAVMRLWCSL
ncbi:MAG: hypothetical protein JSR82_11490 [Verrucomicrobia bacterium]|nr:hypothetical protein [Verrucomicrobiota bacterium]